MNDEDKLEAIASVYEKHVKKYLEASQRRLSGIGCPNDLERLAELLEDLKEILDAKS